MRTVLAGSLALIALHTVVTFGGATGRIGGAFAGVADLVDRFLDPTRPAIAERAQAAAPAPSGVARPAYPAPNFPG